MTPGLLAERSRQTLAAPTSVFEGVGLHSGADASVRVLPAPSGMGRRFVDLQSGQEIPATVTNSQETARCTELRSEKAFVRTVEHLLSSLSALGVDDALIETRGGEIPAADGSAAPFLEWLMQAGVSAQPKGEQAVPVSLSCPVLLTGDNGVTLAALPAPRFRASVLLHFPQPWIGTQGMEFDAGVDDYKHIAPARTFGFVHELDWLRAHGLGLGASHDNALALGEEGYVGTPRFDDELVRHKLLDLIGDLSLIGAPVQAHVIAIKPSHACNLRLARAILESAHAQP